MAAPGCVVWEINGSIWSCSCIKLYTTQKMKKFLLSNKKDANIIILIFFYGIQAHNKKRNPAESDAYRLRCVKVIQKVIGGKR